MSFSHEFTAHFYTHWPFSSGRILSPALLLMCSNAIKCCQPVTSKVITVKHPGSSWSKYIFTVAWACDKLLCHCNLDSSGPVSEIYLPDLGPVPWGSRICRQPSWSQTGSHVLNGRGAGCYRVGLCLRKWHRRPVEATVHLKQLLFRAFVLISVLKLQAKSSFFFCLFVFSSMANRWTGAISALYIRY